jgi:hypothetical protein
MGKQWNELPTVVELENDGFTRGRGRNRLRECRDAFKRDGGLDDEMAEIVEALEDFDFPETAEEYHRFCLAVLCWVPWEFRCETGGDRG